MIASLTDNIRLSLIELITNKLRAFLTVLGITIGIAAVVLLLSLGQGVQQYITSQFEALGTNTIRISAQRDSNGRTDALTTELADRLRAAEADRLQMVDLVMPEATGDYYTAFGDNEFNVSTQGVTTDYLEMEGRSVDTGRFFTEDELNSSAQIAVIGTTTAQNLFAAANPIGQSIRIRNIVFQVIGVLAKSGTSDDLVVIPITSFRARLNNARTTTGESVVNTILVRAKDVKQMTATVDQLTQVLREERGVGSGQSDNFRTFTASTIVDSLTSTIQIITIFLGIVAGISLLVGGINVMNIMLVTITERTREIGLRKATGAQNSDIIVLFLVQAVVLTMIGGTIGVLIAAGGAQLITSLVDNFNVVVQVSSVMLAVGISAAIGIFFGVYPASRAARLNPIDALRYE
jgi:putative ABC transport system permease protein